MKVLITGATGFVGSKLTKFLLTEGFQINYLTTSKKKLKTENNLRGFYWNPSNCEIDDKCIEGVDYIINLSGKSLSGKWTATYKKEILQSRIDSSQTLQKLLSSKPNTVKKVISASAVGIYKNNLNVFQSEETTSFDTGFLGEVCSKWETENQKFNNLGIETLIVRIGLVLSEKEGALPVFTKTVKYYVASSFGTGKQWYSWIHIHDLVRMIHFCLINEVNGVVNAVAPNPKTQKEFLNTLARSLDRRVMLPAIPAKILRAFIGEKHKLVTDSQKVSASKILKLGFNFKYPYLKDAFKNFYGKTA